jgi:Uma2 family endonuclease
VVEILSPSNTVIEMDRKFDLYRVAGVREYWVVSPDEKVIHVHRFQDGKPMLRLQVYKTGDSAVSDILPGLTIPLDAVFTE